VPSSWRPARSGSKALFAISSRATQAYALGSVKPSEGSMQAGQRNADSALQLEHWRKLVALDESKSEPMR